MANGGFWRAAVARLILPVVCLLGVVGAARADAIVGFYAHPWGFYGTVLYVPHAFITIEPVADGETPAAVQADLPPFKSYGFSSAAPGLELTVHPTRGVVMETPKFYIGISKREFAVRISEAQRAALMKAMAEWQAVDGDPYDLHRRNCIVFVAAMARSIGLGVGDEHTLDPVKFLKDMRERNAGRLIVERDAVPSASS